MPYLTMSTATQKNKMLEIFGELFENGAVLKQFWKKISCFVQNRINVTWGAVFINFAVI